MAEFSIITVGILFVAAVLYSVFQLINSTNDKKSKY